MQLSPFLRCFPYHRSPFQGTHGDRVAGDTLGRDITYAISLIMPLRLRGSYATQCHAFSYFTSSPTLDLLAAVAARVPSSKLHIPFIRTLRIGRVRV